MERSNCRLYSGPLSVAAQKILGALQAQRRHVAGQNHTYYKSHHLLETRKNGSQWEPLSQSYISQEKKDPLSPRPLVSPLSRYNPQWQDSPTSTYNELSQTQDYSQSSQASSCLDASQHRRTPQTEAYYQHSQMFSHWKQSESRTYRPEPGQALSFSQWDVSETGLSQKDKHTPQRLPEQQVTPWRDSEEITPQFSIGLSPEHTDDFFAITAGQKDKTEHQIFAAFDVSKEINSSSATVKDKWLEMEIIENIPQRDSQDSTSHSYYLHETTKTGEKHGSLKPITFNRDQENKVKDKMYFTNQHDAPDDVLKMREEKQTTEPNAEVSDVEMEDLLFHNNSINTSHTKYGATPDVSDEPVIGEEKSLGYASVSEEIVFHVESELYKDSPSQSELKGRPLTKTSEIYSSKGPLIQTEPSKLVPVDNTADKVTTEESADLLQDIEEVTEGSVVIKKDWNEAELDKQRETDHKEYNNTNEKGVSSEDSEPDRLEMSAVGRGNGNVATENSQESCATPVMAQECREGVSGVRYPSVEGDTHSHHDKLQAPSEGKMDSNMFSGVLLESAAVKSSCQNDPCNIHNPHKKSYQPPFKPSFTLKRKYEKTLPQSPTIVSFNFGTARRSLKWEPPRSSQEQADEGRKRTERFCDHSDFSPNQSKVGNGMAIDLHDPRQTLQFNVKKKYKEPIGKAVKHVPTSADCTPETAQEGASHVEHRSQSKAGSLNSSLTSDPRVTDSSRMTQDQMEYFLKKAGQSEAFVLIMVYRDGTTQLDSEQKLTPPVCGLLLLMKNQLDRSTPDETLGPNDTLVYLKLERAPAWAKQPAQHHQELFTRDLLLQVFSPSQLVVCYKSKDVLCVILQLYKRDLTWKQVVGCQIQDPQVSGWLLDPADPASCFPELLNKHCKKPLTTPAFGSKKVSQIIGGLYSLYELNRKLCSKLKSQGLWGLYSDMELKMIPVLAAMESCHIHVDKEALRRTSDLLGTKMKQLEQEAHKAAGQMFLLTSSTQLRTVLFEKLRLHERCENKKLPKTINKQQSTSEAALLQLQDLHPLPKIILEYRQVHKIKSTFVDGILSCMMTKNYISSTWYQTSAVTGRISAKHPNFQALPRQPLQVTRKQYIPGKEDEVVTVHPRAMFIPKEGWTFLSADFCQVELRLLAHLSSDPELLRIFTVPEADVFSMLASQWKGVGETEVTPEEREHTKRIVYSVVYGAGPERLSGILGVSTEQARRFQDSFLQTYKEVQTFIQKTVAQCHKKGYVLSIMGRRRSLPNINSPDWAVRMQAERQAVNFVVQGSAADLCKMAMIRIFHLLSSSSSLAARLIAQIHDELLYEVEDSQIQQFAAVVKSTMESLQHIDQLAVPLRVPLKVAVSSGKSWGSMSELNIPPSQPPPLNL